MKRSLNTKAKGNAFRFDDSSYGDEVGTIRSRGDEAGHSCRGHGRGNV